MAPSKERKNTVTEKKSSKKRCRTQEKFRAHEQKKKKVKKVILSLQNTWVQEKILGLATKTLECQQRQKQ